MGSQYILVETSAPNGFKQWDGKVMLSVDVNGNITITKEFTKNLISYSNGTLTLLDEPIQVVPAGFTQEHMPFIWLLIMGLFIILSMILFLRRISE